MNRSVPYVFFTDLDGTLLDDKYTYDAARPALDALRARHLPLVFCTSKTREEVDALRIRLNNKDPFIVENGAAIFIPRGYFPFPVPGRRTQGRYDVIEFGTPYRTILAALRRAAQDSECDVVGFAEMSAAAIAVCAASASKTPAEPRLASTTSRSSCAATAPPWSARFSGASSSRV